MDIQHFPHQFIPGDSSVSAPNLLLLHGTGGSEHDLIPLAQQLSPGSGLLSPRGQVSEQGAARFFSGLRKGCWILMTGGGAVRGSDYQER